MLSPYVAGIDNAVIGQMTEKNTGTKLTRGPRTIDLPVFQVDEITKLF